MTLVHSRFAAKKFAPMVKRYQKDSFGPAETIEDLTACAGDFVADLMHWCFVNEINFDEVLEKAFIHYRFEIDNENEEELLANIRANEGLPS